MLTSLYFNAFLFLQLRLEMPWSIPLRVITDATRISSLYLFVKIMQNSFHFIRCSQTLTGCCPNPNLTTIGASAENQHQ